jgi:hypothetical protein
LGYVVSPARVLIKKSQVEAIVEWPAPQSVCNVQVFIGFANFYWQFVARFLAIARPLTSLTGGRKKG